MLGRITAYAAWGVLVLALLGGCAGEGGGGSLPSPTISPTRTLPEPTRTAESPAPTETDGGETTSPEPEPTETEPAPEPTETERAPEPTETEPAPEPTETEPAPEPTETEPAPEPTETRSEPAPVPSETESPSGGQADETDADAKEQAEEDGTPPWLWWLVAGLLALAVLVIVLVVRSRRRGSWQNQLDEAVAEVAWFARELLPQLRRAGSVERMAGGWQVESARVAAIEDRLTGLEATAPDETGRARTRDLRDAVRTARGHVQALTAPGPHPEWALDLDDVIASLEAALGQATA